MLPGGPVDKRSQTVPRQCGRFVRTVIEVLIFYNVCASKVSLKRKKRVKNRKFECFKSLMAWVLIFSLLYILVFAEPPSDVQVIEKKFDAKDFKRVKSPLSKVKNGKYRHSSYVNNDIYVERNRAAKEKPEVSIDPPREELPKEPDNPPQERENVLPKEKAVQLNKPTDLSLDENINRLQEKLDEVTKELSYFTNMKTDYERADSVKRGFKHAFDGYERFAWGHDEIRPESNETNDSWGGFGVTMIDSLSTMCVLGFEDYINKAEEHVRHLNFEKDVVVSFFETTIRHLGGLLSGFECSKRKVFLEKAIELADQMIPAFESPSGYPYHQINLKTGEKKNAAWVREQSILSEVASIQLEWYALSLYSGDPKYHEISKKALDRVLENEIEDYPGLYYNFLDIKTGGYTSQTRNIISIGGAGDSFYEYLLKISLMLPITTVEYVDEKQQLVEKYEESIAAIRKFLVKEWGQAENGQKRSYVGTIGDGDDEMEHLVCFFPGLLTLGYIDDPLGKKTDLDLAKEILETCIHMYESNSNTGLAPDRFVFDNSPEGYRIQNPKFILRPETIESLFYMYRATGDRRYQDIGWRIWQSIEKHCRTGSSYTGLESVRDGRTNNSMQSFFLSEVLKYLFLLFHPESENIVDLHQHVFSTEGQILKRF